MGSLNVNYNINPKIDPTEATQAIPVEPRPTDPTNRFVNAVGFTSKKVDAAGVTRCVGRYEFLQRMQFASFFSAQIQSPGGGAGQEAYVFSDPVDLDKWRVITQCTIGFLDPTGNAQVDTALWLLPPLSGTQGIPFTGIPFSTSGALSTLFADYANFASGGTSPQNWPPLRIGLRVDFNPSASSQSDPSLRVGPEGLETPAIQKPLIVPPGWRILASSTNGAVNNRNAGARIELRFTYTDLFSNEELAFEIGA